MTEPHDDHANKLMAAACVYLRQTGNTRVPRDEVAPSIGLDTPLLEFTQDFGVFREASLELKGRRYITGIPVNFEWLQLTDDGIRACELGVF